MDLYCRLCGSEEGFRVSIFEPGKDHVKKIHKILPITVNEHDPFPKSMCHRCHFKVNEFFEFRTNCIKAQEVFKSKVPWLRDKQATFIDEGHPPMVEVPLNSVNAISPNEKDLPQDPLFIDEDPTIVIEDDSPPTYKETAVSSLLLNPPDTQEKNGMLFKKSDGKKKARRSIWDRPNKKRKRKHHDSCKIAEVFATSIDEYQNIADIENDPLRISPDENNENLLTKITKTEHNSVEKGILTNDKAGENMKLPKHILITNIPRVGYVFTCEKCGRTFLSPQPAHLHVCGGMNYNEDEKRPKENDQEESSNSKEFYSCNECGSVFTRHSQLLYHQKSHNEVETSSDETFKPFNKRKHHRKKRNNSRILSNNSLIMSFDETDSGILRHSLLSSDSE